MQGSMGALVVHMTVYLYLVNIVYPCPWKGSMDVLVNIVKKASEIISISLSRSFDN